jgi:hypothetical protein
MNKKFQLSDEVQLHAEKRARNRDFSVEAYLNALIIQDDDPTIGMDKDWLEREIDKGLASGDAGVLTRERLHQLVSEDIERARRRT